MQLRPRNQLVSTIHNVTYRDKRAKGDRPKDWAYANKSKRKPGRVVQVSVESYLNSKGA